MRALLLTSTNADALTGGSLYHRRIAERSAAVGLEVEPRPLEGAVGGAFEDADVVIVDSIVAARFRPSDVGRPIVASVHQRPGGLVGSPIERARRAVLDLRCYRGADAVVVPSAYLARALRAGGVRADRIRVVPPGCDVRLVAPRAERAHGAIRFVSVANLSRHKRPLDTLEAFASASASAAETSAVLTLVGGAADERIARRVVARLAGPDLANRARWIGPLAPEDLADELASSDVFVLPALHESFGMAVAEAMSFGLPAIVARSGNLPALVRDGIDGFVVAPRDRDALASAIRRLARDADLRERMSASARAAARSFPTWDEAARGFVGVVRAAQSGSMPIAPGLGMTTSAS